MLKKLPRAHLAAFAFYLLVAVLITWPLLTVFSTHLIEYPDGDAHEMARHIWWMKHALQTGQPVFFQPLLGYPDGMEGVILWSDPLQFFPGWLFAFVMPLPAAYNLFVLLTLALDGWAMFFLVGRLTGSRRAALLAGVVFMAAPTMQGHLAGGHGGLLVQWPLPLYVWALFRLRQGERKKAKGKSELPVTSYQLPEEREKEKGERKKSEAQAMAESVSDAPELGTGNSKLETGHLKLSTQYSVLSTYSSVLLAALFFFLVSLGHTLQAVYALLPVTIWFAGWLLLERDWRTMWRLAAAVMLGAGALALFLLPVARATFGTEAYTGERGDVRYSIDLLAVATPSFNHPLFGQLDYTHRVLGVNIVEGSSYVGIAAGLLVLLAVWKRRAARPWLALGALAWVLALGPLLKVLDTPVAVNVGGYATRVPLPWALVADLPGFSLARTPGRFSFVLALVVAVLAGCGAATLFNRQDAKDAEKENKSKHSHLLPLALRGFRERGLIITHLTPRPPLHWMERGSDTAGKAPLHVWRGVGVRFGEGILLILLIAFILYEYQSFWPAPLLDARIPDAVSALANRSDVRAVLDVPADNVLADKDALWLQTAHGKPLIAGHVTRSTPVSPAKLALLGRLLDPALLKAAGADVVIVHKQYDPGLLKWAKDVLGSPGYEDDKLALFNVPQPSSLPPDVALSPQNPSPYPAFLSIPEKTTITEPADNYLYVPEAGWVGFQSALQADEQVIAVLLDGRTIRRWTVRGDERFELRIPVTQPGYHTVTLALDRPCPISPDPALVCRSVQTGFTGMSFSPAPHPFVPVDFANGIHLLGSLLSEGKLSLWWKFDAPVNAQEVRFIHVLDKDGKLAWQNDGSLGEFAANSEWVEDFPLPADLPKGEYTVVVGWYAYPDTTPFCVLANGACSAEGTAEVGKLVVP
jgi:hypothetical protein